jgi:hypothetical protein
VSQRRRDLSALTPVERGILDLCLNPRAWHTPTARCTVEHMAGIVGCTERQVYRARRRLRDVGVISWILERAPGVRYDHAVYTINENYWKPPKPHERGRIARGFARRRRRTQCQGEEIERKASRSTTSPPSIAQARSSPQRPLLDAAGLLRHLESHGHRTRGDHACCPAHDDRHPSLRIGYGDGRTMLHCHAGCDPGDVLAAAGLHWRDLDGYPHRPPDVRVKREVPCREVGRHPDRIDGPPLRMPASWQTLGFEAAWRALRNRSPYDPTGGWA